MDDKTAELLGKYEGLKATVDAIRTDVSAWRSEAKEWRMNTDARLDDICEDIHGERETSVRSQLNKLNGDRKVVLAVISAVMFLTGSGTISLEKIIAILSKPSAQETQSPPAPAQGQVGQLTPQVLPLLLVLLHPAITNFAIC